YWREALTSDDDGGGRLEFSRPLAVATGRGREFVTLETELQASLEARARETGVTLATVLQAAWLRLLAAQNASATITIGVTRSGRQAPLSGIVDAVGLFIETLPVRTTLAPARRLADWLRELQTMQAEQEMHGHIGLAEIKRLADTGVGAPLFEALFVLENYPLDASLVRFADLEVRDLTARDGAHYPLALSV